MTGSEPVERKNHPVSISSPLGGREGLISGPNAIVRLLDRCQRGDVAGSAVGPPGWRPALTTVDTNERENKQTPLWSFSELEYDSTVAVFFVRDGEDLHTSEN
jgi:hypothetical protein